MTHKLALIGLGAGCLLLAGDESKQKVQVTKTERMDLASGGVLKVTNSIGELTVEGWDRSDVEITTIKSTKIAYDPREREKAGHELEEVRVAAERHGDEIILKTNFPRHRSRPPFSPLGGATNFDLEYDIKVPRNVRLIVDHDVGEVHVENLTGDIHVTALQGGITLRLPETGQYAIDAKSDFGSVTSDFAERAKRRLWLVGHQFSQNSPTASQNLYLRVGYGDIIILQARKPTAPCRRSVT